MKTIFIICGIIWLGIAAFIYYQMPQRETSHTNVNTAVATDINDTTNAATPAEETAPAPVVNSNTGSANLNIRVNATVPAEPALLITRAKERITKKPFGIYITPKTSPIQPEQFSGYHTGTDFEIFSDEKEVPVPISAFCDGKLLYKKWVNGYGGVLIQSCTINEEMVTVLYGHLNVDSITKNIGNTILKNDFIGNLGNGYSQQTDGERKHLHFAIHKGSDIELKGYVSQTSSLSAWLDPEKFF